MLEYHRIEHPDLDQQQAILALYQNENWWTGDADIELVARIVAGSHVFLVAEENGVIIGMARAISDGVSDAYIQDVTVAEDHRGRKIGSALIHRLVAILREGGIDWVGLIAERGSEAFYRTIGFSEMKGGVPMLLDSTLLAMGQPPDSAREPR